MTAQAQSVIDQLFALPAAVREEVLTHLVATMDIGAEPSVEEKSDIAREWQVEIDRRVSEVEAGTADLMDGDEAIGNFRSRFV